MARQHARRLVIDAADVGRSGSIRRCLPTIPSVGWRVAHGPKRGAGSVEPAELALRRRRQGAEPGAAAVQRAAAATGIATWVDK